MRLLYYLPMVTILLLANGPSRAQTPASSTFQTNNVRAVVNANGALFTDFQQGQFVPVQPGLAEKTLLRSSGIWIAGLDPAGQLQGAVQVGNQNDFQAGGISDENQAYELNRIWRVSCGDINAYLADLQDNGHVDQPNAAVYAWPGMGNAHNGLGGLFTIYGMAGYYDSNDDLVYEPNYGDYPGIEVRGCPLDRYPDDMGWFMSNDGVDTSPHASGFKPLQMEVQTEVMAYKIQPATSLLNNTIYVRYKLINRGATFIDSCYFGLFTDFSIGNGGDDFVGSIPDRHLIYAYNGDGNDEGGFGAEAPVMAVELLRGPLDTFGYELPLHHFVALENAGNLQALSYYRLLSGSLPDGTPAPDNGFMYPGNPNLPAESSEVSAGHTPGHRSGVASYGPVTLKPGAVNELIVAYHYVYQPGNTALQNVQALYDQGTDAARQLFDNCFAELPGQMCDALVEAPEPRLDPQELHLYPNPASEGFTLESTRQAFSRIEVTDLLGRPVLHLELAKATQKQTVATGHWPAGLYALRVGGQLRTVAIQH